MSLHHVVARTAFLASSQLAACGAAADPLVVEELGELLPDIPGNCVGPIKPVGNHRAAQVPHPSKFADRLNGRVKRGLTVHAQTCEFAGWEQILAGSVVAEPLDRLVGRGAADAGGTKDKVRQLVQQSEGPGRLVVLIVNEDERSNRVREREASKCF